MPKKNLNPNNCETCAHRAYQEPDAHCYMFREPPEVACASHTGNRMAWREVLQDAKIIFRGLSND